MSGQVILYFEDQADALRIPLHAVYEHAPRLPKPDPEEPGPFAFAETARVTRIRLNATNTGKTRQPNPERVA